MSIVGGSKEEVTFCLADGTSVVAAIFRHTILLCQLVLVSAATWSARWDMEDTHVSEYRRGQCRRLYADLRVT